MKLCKVAAKLGAGANSSSRSTTLRAIFFPVSLSDLQDGGCSVQVLVLTDGCTDAWHKSAGTHASKTEPYEPFPMSPNGSYLPWARMAFTVESAIAILTAEPALGATRRRSPPPQRITHKNWLASDGLVAYKPATRLSCASVLHEQSGVAKVPRASSRASACHWQRQGAQTCICRAPRARQNSQFVCPGAPVTSSSASVRKGCHNRCAEQAACRCSGRIPSS